jgi:glutamine cyclotransferase
MLQATTIILFLAFIFVLEVSQVKADDGSGTNINEAEEYDVNDINASLSGKGDIVKSISAPGYGDPRGLTWDGTYLWMAEDDSKMIYKIDPSDGNVIYSFSTPGHSFTEGLAWDGTYIWHAEYNGNVYKINPGNGSVIKTISAPTIFPTGLTWDGTYLWTASYRDDMIYQFSPSDGSLVNSFPPPGNHPWGMTYDGIYLWHSEYSRGNIYQLEPSDGTITTSFPSPPYSSLLGLTWDGTYLWSVDHSADMIYQIYVSEPSPPVADADGPYSIYMGDTLTLDAGGSTDDGNDITSYMWDLNDDETFETDAGGQAIFDINYTHLQSLGLLINHTYTIHLKVTDSKGPRDVAESKLTIIPKPATVVAVDIKPGSCPNPVNVKSKGVLPIAILGTVDYDVTTIDPISIRLTGIEPLRSVYEDVAGPVSDGNDCNCITEGPDGFLDLTLKFETQRIVEAVGDVNDGDVLTLELNGVLETQWILTKMAWLTLPILSYLHKTGCNQAL